MRVGGCRGDQRAVAGHPDDLGTSSPLVFVVPININTPDNFHRLISRISELLVSEPSGEKVK